MFKANRLVYHSTLGWRVIKKKKDRASQSKSRPSLSSACGPAKKPTSHLRQSSAWYAEREPPSRFRLHWYLAHKKQRPPRTLL